MITLFETPQKFPPLNIDAAAFIMLFLTECLIPTKSFIYDIHNYFLNNKNKIIIINFGVILIFF